MDGCGEKSETRAESQPLNERDKSVGGWVEDKAIGRDTLRNRKVEDKKETGGKRECGWGRGRKKQRMEGRRQRNIENL